MIVHRYCTKRIVTDDSDDIKNDKTLASLLNLLNHILARSQ